MNNVIIIGGGCAGMTAAIYSGRAELKPLVFVGDNANRGGLLSKTSLVENYPGFPTGINGFDLVDQMERQAIACGAEIKEAKIVSVSKLDQKFFELTDDNYKKYLTKSVIIATGSYPNKLGLPNEENLWGKGISSCAVCDGVLYKKKKIIVLGGGDTAMEHALFLTKFSNVTLIHRQNKFRASKLMQTRTMEHPKINIIYDTIVTELHGENSLIGITTKNVLTGVISHLQVDGLFYGLGLNPNTQIFDVEKNNGGYISVCKKDGFSTMTSIPGIFVAGDAHDDIYRQAVIAAGDGCRAAMDVHKYLEHTTDDTEISIDH
jgi:thioredoxin reductase (NADPH)